MPSSDDRLVAHYDDALAAHGPTAQGACWGGPEIQRLNFEEICRVADLSGATVLEIGCGTAALAAFLRDRFSDVAYTGTDISGDVLAAARVAEPRVELCEHDIVAGPVDGPFDWVVASGTFNLTELGHHDQIRRVRQGLGHMFDSCTRGVACTFLSDASRSGPVGETVGALRFHYERPGELLSAALEITPHAVLRHALVDADAMTLYLYRDPASYAARAIVDLPDALSTPIALRTRLDALGFVGRLEDAAAIVEAIPAGPLRDFAHGMLHLELDEPEAAHAALERAVDHVPDARPQLAAVAWALGDYDRAAELLEHHLADASDAAIEIYVEACLQRGDHERAEAALQTRPQRAHRAFLAARVAHVSGDDARAEAELRAAWADAPYSEAVALHLFLLTRGRGDDRQAYHWGQRARSLGSDNPQLAEELDELSRALLGDDPSATPDD